MTERKKKIDVDEAENQPEVGAFSSDAFGMGFAGSDTEGEDDLERPDLNRLGEAVVAASDWTAETIVRQLDRGNINISPSFQRRDAWTAARKSKFIESKSAGTNLSNYPAYQELAKQSCAIVAFIEEPLSKLWTFIAIVGGVFAVAALIGRRTYSLGMSMDRAEQDLTSQLVDAQE